MTIADRIGITDGIATTAAEFAQPNPDRMFCLLTRLMVIDQGMAHMRVCTHLLCNSYRRLQTLVLLSSASNVSFSR